MKNKNRYFLITYVALTKNGDKAHGNATIITNDGEYINRKSIKAHIHKEEGFVKISLTNIIELTESDHNDYTSDE